jgi:hypothetical protein
VSLELLSKEIGPGEVGVEAFDAARHRWVV